MPLGTEQLMEMREKGRCEKMGERQGKLEHTDLTKKAFRIILTCQPTKHVCRPLGLIGPKSYIFGDCCWNAVQSRGKDLPKVTQLVSERGPSPPIWQNESHGYPHLVHSFLPSANRSQPPQCPGILLCRQGPSSEPDMFSIFKKVSVQ